MSPKMMIRYISGMNASLALADLKAFTKKFFERNVVGTNRNDLNLYLIFSYLSFFRLEELSMDDFKKLVLS